MLLPGILLLLGLVWPVGQDPSGVPVRPVATVDLARYAGLWHEVARLPNRFQARCLRETTAEYTLLRDGQVQVVNSCRTAEGIIRAEGRAKLADASGPTSKLKVRFAPRILSFLPMVWGDYWILDLTEDYRAALVGSPDRKNLWVLSRTPDLDPETFGRLVATARSQGFPVDQLIGPGMAHSATSR
jgi:apolipoprotein D and lipocalin family protein